MLKIYVEDLSEYHLSQYSCSGYDAYELPIPINGRQYLVRLDTNNGKAWVLTNDLGVTSLFNMYIGYSLYDKGGEYIDLLQYEYIDLFKQGGIY